ncbi:MAG TPA: SRPBCC domain-containing protein [Oculatellaceae cyanobacterium]
MPNATKTLEFKFTRKIPASSAEVFDAWLDPKIPGNPWNEGDKLIFDPRLDGVFYWLIHGIAHYGRFTEITRPGRLQHTWMSVHTLGEESTVTVTFKSEGDDTVMTLVHSGLPDAETAKAHEDGWNYYLDKLTNNMGAFAHQRK